MSTTRRSAVASAALASIMLAVAGAVVAAQVTLPELTDTHSDPDEPAPDPEPDILGSRLSAGPGHGSGRRRPVLPTRER